MSRQRRLLIVDDEPLICWALKERLEADGFDVVQTHVGQEACDYVSRGVDLVLLDHRLSDTDGLSLLRRIRATNPGLPVIMVTASANFDVTREATRLGIHAVIPKPFNLDHVAQTIAAALLH